MVNWLMMIYKNPRLKVSDDNKSVFAAYTQIQKLPGYLETFENNLKNYRVEIENTLQLQKKKFVEQLDEIKQEVDKFKENQTTQKKDEYNKSIAKINQTL